MFCSNKKPLLLMHVWVPVVAGLLSWSGACPALAGWDSAAKVIASDAGASDNFGYSVAVCENIALIGSRGDDDAGSDSGSAYVFHFDGVSWSEQEKLLASDGAAGDRFGHSVSVFDDVAVVGAPYDDDSGSDSGSVYVFRLEGATWMEEQKLLASDGAASDKFGYSVAISGNTIVVGAYGDDDSGSSSGSVYVFRHDGSSWAQEQKLLASDGAASDFFGIAVSVSGSDFGDVAVVGAHQDDDAGASSGSAYVFRCAGSSWIEEQKLVASDGAESDLFGRTLSVFGEVVAVGAYQDDDNGSQSGSAYVFHFDGSSWVEEAKLLASDGADVDQFGCSVAASGETVVVGARWDDDPFTDAGSAYVFGFNGSIWIEEAKLLAPDGYWWDTFGSAVAISGDVVVVGAIQEDAGYNDSGSAYIFEFESSSVPDCNGNGVADDVDIADGTSEDCDGNGVPDECQTDSDGDGLIDPCDGCPSDPDKTEPGQCGCGVPDTDTDGDGTPDCNDGCPNDPDKTEPGQCGCGVPDTDTDGDGTPDCNDGCPNDPDKTEPGQCGCGVPDTDTDGDGTPDCNDGCPNDPDKTEPGQCGCGVPDTDTDGDGTPDCNDGCPNDPDKTEPGQCGCGVPDTDTDGDGTPDCNDGCPNDPDKTEPGQCGCGVPDTDTDGDGTADCNDSCPGDPDKTEPGDCGCGTPDTDSDGDAVADCIDNCPSTPNPDQADCDSDGVGDACAGEPDCNNNGVPDSCDIANGTSADDNGNGIPDECEGSECIDDVANGETSVSGTVSGTYTDTWSDDTIYEVITERESGGKPQNRYSYLEHKWAFDVAGGNSVTFFFNGFRTVSSDGDDFVFAYSTDDVNYSNMFTVFNTVDDGTYQSCVLPSSTCGTVYIRVVDTDRTPANRTLDGIYVDHLFIRSETQPGDPPAAPSNLSATAVAYDQIDLSWTDNAVDETGFEIERSLDSASWELIGSAGADITTYSDAGLAPSTTYYYRVRAFNGSGASSCSNTAFASTLEGPGIVLEGIGFTLGKKQVVDLTWNGAISANVDIYRNGEFLVTTPNDGFYRDTLGKDVTGTFIYEVCEEGSSTDCSNTVTITF